MTPLAAKPRAFSTAKRSAARLAAVQALYEIEVGGRRPQRVVDDFERQGFPREADAPQSPESDLKLFAAVVTGAEKGRAELDRLIQSALDQDRHVERLEAVLRAVLRAGAFELKERADVPPRVVISEYVDVAHAFFFGTEPTLVNAVLDRLARDLRPAEMQKRERGGPEAQG